MNTTRGRGFIRSGAIAASFALVTMVAADVAADSAPTEASEAWPYLHSLPVEQRMEVLKREAAREGRLVIYAAIGLDRANVWLEPFKEANPDIEVEYLRMKTNELAQKALTEARAGRTDMDIFMSSSDWLALVSETLAPYVPTTWDKLDPRFRHGSVEEGWTAIDFDSLVEVIAWRTDRLSSDEAPKNLMELADPKWKGRTGTVRVREPFIAAMIDIHGEESAMKQVEQLAALENRIFPSIAGLSEGLSAGEVDVAWGVSGARAARLKATGVPVDFVMQQPPMTLNETMAAGRMAKNPYAAALLMEYVTAVETMEASDKIEPGRVFGHTEGTFTIPLASDIYVYDAIPPDRYGELNRIVEELFIR